MTDAPFALPPQHPTEAARNRLQRVRFRLWRRRLQAAAEDEGGRRMGRQTPVRTLWHARADDARHALCGDEEAVVITAERQHVTCPRCLERLRQAEEEDSRHG